MGRSWDEIKAQKRPARDEVPLSLDPALAQAYAEAQQKLDEARQSLEFRPDSVERQERFADAESALEEAREALEPSLVYFSIEALGREEFEELIDDCPPSKEQRDRYRKENPQQAAAGFNLRWDREKFAPLLFSKCVVDPELTSSQAKELWAGGVFNQGEVEFLFQSCLNVNQQARVVDLGKGSKRTASSGSSSPSALTTA